MAGTAVLLRRETVARPCDAPLVISASPVRGRCDGASGAVIDRFTVWRDGAQAVWLHPDGARILSDRDVRGARPWVALGPERRGAVLLPPAPLDE